MTRFEVGQEVIFSKGDLKDVRGVILNPYFQLSQSDWPEVIVEYEGDRRFFVNVDDVRPAEDPYEYSVQFHWLHNAENVWTEVSEHDWMDKEDAENWLQVQKDTEKRAEREGKAVKAVGRLVKRRKAGRTEVV